MNQHVREISEASAACELLPHPRLIVVIDNLRQIHDHPRFLASRRKLRITLAFTPTESSWLNLMPK